MATGFLRTLVPLAYLYPTLDCKYDMITAYNVLFLSNILGYILFQITYSPIDQYKLTLFVFSNYLQAIGLALVLYSWYNTYNIAEIIYNSYWIYIIIILLIIDILVVYNAFNITNMRTFLYAMKMALGGIVGPVLLICSYIIWPTSRYPMIGTICINISDIALNLPEKWISDLFYIISIVVWLL